MSSVCICFKLFFIYKNLVTCLKKNFEIYDPSFDWANDLIRDLVVAKKRGVNVTVIIDTEPTLVV